jgi:P4 family phage/plasmid primase-like protien
MSAIFQTPTLTEAFDKAGLALPAGASTGCLVHFSTCDDPADASGWLSILADGAGAAFGCLRSGRSFAWVQNRGGVHALGADEIKRTIARVSLARDQLTGQPEVSSTPIPERVEPAPVPDRYAALPDAMRNAPRWIVWKSIPNRDPSKKARKVPFYVSGVPRNGETDTPIDRAKLAKFDAALAAWATGKYTGLGFALGDDGTGNCWQGVDLDHLSARPELNAVGEALTGYTETSPSGDGMHAIGYGAPFAAMGSNATGIEAYSSGRYFTVTGANGSGVPVCLADTVNNFLRPLHSAATTSKKENGARTGGGEADETPFEMVNPDTVTHLRSALTFMRADDRDIWQKNGHRLKALGDIGRELWLTWSATSEKYDPQDASRTWDSFKPSHTSYKAIFKDAQDGGWVNPTSRAGRKASKHDSNRLMPVGDGNISTDSAHFDVPTLGGADERDGTATTRPLSEFGNALRMIDTHGENLRYVPELKNWIVFKDDSWQGGCGSALVKELVARMAYTVYTEGAQFRMDAAESFAKWARNSQKAQIVNNTVKLLESESEVRLPLGQIDADTMLAGFDQARCVLDLRTGVARDATTSDYVTKSLTPRTLGDASMAVRWLAFLDQIFDGDAELIGWLKRWCGYLLTGDTSEQILLFLFGQGANGKSVFAEVIRHILGDYGSTIPSEMLSESKKQAGGATPDLAALVGRRLALCNETEDGRALAESLIKSLTGGDSISARANYGAPFEFKPAFRLLVVGNHRPIIRGNDYGIWRRIRLVPFNRTFTEQERDPLLIDKLKAEAQHILAWMVEGCVEWQREKLTVLPSIVASQTADYRKDQDVIGRWLDECVVFVDGAEVEKAELYDNYREWALANGLKPASNVSIGRRIPERGIAQRMSHGVRLWCGISLKPNKHASYSQFV